MTEPLLVPLDGSALAERALPYASSLARAGNRSIVLVRVAEHDGSSADLDAAAERMRADGVGVETVVAPRGQADVAHVLLQVAATHGCTLIVMSTHGSSGLGRWLYGGVAEHVLSQASIPVLLVWAASDHAWPTSGAQRVLVPWDGSDRARGAIEPMLASVGANDWDVALVRVVTPPTGGAAAYMFEDLPAEVDDARESVEREAEALRCKGWQVRGKVVLGPVAGTIARVALDEAVDLIAMATHGRSGLARLVLGSVATEMLHRAHVPVLLLRTAD